MQSTHSKSKRGQGAFEYLMSYGWAVLVVIVLGIVLFNLGVFNPNQAASFSGFSVFRPQSWGATALNDTASNLTVAFTNVAGIDLTLAVNGSTGILLSKPNCNGVRELRNGGCASGQWCATNSQGVAVSSTTGSISVPAGNTMVVNIMALGNSTAGYTGCGGIKGQSYRLRLDYVTATDGFAINHADNGYINRAFQ